MKKKPISPKARPGNQNAAKPPEDRRVSISARVSPTTAAILRSYGAGNIGLNIDAAAPALRALVPEKRKRSGGSNTVHEPQARQKTPSESSL